MSTTTQIKVECPYCNVIVYLYVPYAEEAKTHITECYFRNTVEGLIGCGQSFAIKAKWLHEAIVYKLVEHG